MKNMPQANKHISPRAAMKRKAILEAAWKAFSEAGYEKTSMDAVIALSGGSKATLYGYFKSKEELLYEALKLRVQELTENAEYKFSQARDVQEELYNFGLKQLNLIVNTDLLEVYRLIIAENNDLKLVIDIFYPSMDKLWGAVEDFLRQNSELKDLPNNEVKVASQNFRSLLTGSVLVDALLGNVQALSKKEMHAITKNAVDAFAKLYLRKP